MEIRLISKNETKMVAPLVASFRVALFNKGEELAKSFGESTVYNYVHPNNERMISFLRKHGYSVLNLIEIRKPYPNEKLIQKIKVGNNEFDY